MENNTTKAEIDAYALFCKIDRELIQNRESLESIFLFCTFEIDKYEKCDEYEIVTFDLAAQNTGNVFTYKYDFKTGEYELLDYLMFTYIGPYNFPGLNNEVLDEIFTIARTNEAEIVKASQRINN